VDDFSDETESMSYANQGDMYEAPDESISGKLFR